MSSRPKIHPQARPTCQTSRETSSNWRKCTRLHIARLSNLQDQRYFSHALARLKFQSLKMPIPTRQKTSNTMAPRLRYSPSHFQHTHPCKTPLWQQPCLRHADASRPAKSRYFGVKSRIWTGNRQKWCNAAMVKWWMVKWCNGEKKIRVFKKSYQNLNNHYAHHLS